MRIGCLEEIHAIGDNATRFKALAILRALYPNDTVIFYGRKNVAKMFFHSNIFDEFVNIVQAFVNSYGDNMEYVQYCTSGTSSAQSVQGRFDYWKNLCKGL